MEAFGPQPGLLTEEEVSAHEQGINRIAWAGGIAVALVTGVLLVFALSQADAAWQVPLYALLGGIPFAYAAFCNLVIRKMQVAVLHRYQSQLITQLNELEEVASRDELTGLYNRRHFYQAMEYELGKARVSKEALALLLMDLDGLKGVNDEYGHNVGDVVITSLAKVMVKHTRGTDVPARLGGDEFGILMPGTDKRGAFALARRLWEELEQTPMYEHQGQYIMVTVSIGVSGYPWGGEDIDELFQWADADMYANKVSRRLPQAPAPVNAVKEMEALPEEFTPGM